MDYKLGAHIPARNSAARQEELGADIVQILLGSPRRWGNTEKPSGEIASPFYVHAPYLINLSSVKPELLEKSIETLNSQAEMAAELGAEGLVLHGGSWKKGLREFALHQWQDVLIEPQPLPILIENSASGDHSLTRWAEDFSELWDTVYGGERSDIGWCLDTAHLWAASAKPNEELADLLEYLGSPNLIHANGSAAERASKMDRHSPWECSLINPDTLVHWVKEAGCRNVIVESSDPESDLTMMKEMINDV